MHEYTMYTVTSDDAYVWIIASEHDRKRWFSERYAVSDLALADTRAQKSGSANISSGHLFMEPSCFHLGVCRCRRWEKKGEAESPVDNIAPCIFALDTLLSIDAGKAEPIVSFSQHLLRHFLQSSRHETALESITFTFLYVLLFLFFFSLTFYIFDEIRCN